MDTDGDTEAIEVWISSRSEPNPQLTVLGRTEDGQLRLVATILLGPFQDWENTTQRLMRAILPILHARGW